MTGKWLNISQIEDYLFSITYKKVDTNVYVGESLPNTLSKDLKSLVLLDCGVSISDFDAYGSGVVLVYLFAKPAANGSKNVPVLNSLEEKLLSVVETAKHEHYVISRRGTYTGYDANHDLHFNIVELNLTVI